jgi:predicted nucleic acid-binding protein
MVDASPLIYLAKIDALDVFMGAGFRPMVTPAVERETATAGLAYEHPDAAVVANAIRDGTLEPTKLSREEEQEADRLMAASGGLDRGEAEVLAAAASRTLPVLLFERRATRLAASLGLEAWSAVEILVAGTPDGRLLRTRVLAFAGLVNMRFADLDALLRRIEGDDR